jgi:hypothetical protein
MGFGTINDIIDVPFVDDFLDCQEFVFGEKHFGSPWEWGGVDVFIDVPNRLYYQLIV